MFGNKKAKTPPAKPKKASAKKLDKPAKAVNLAKAVKPAKAVKTVKAKPRGTRRFGCVMWLAVLSLVTLGGAYFGYESYVGTLAPPETVAIRQPPSSTKIYDRNGTFLYEIFDPMGGRRTLVSLSKVPQTLRDATIATEDADFYQNPGISLKGLLRAVIKNVQAGEVVEGGSGITQQLVKNVIIPPEERYEQTFDRKIREAVLAFEITRRYSKDQILQWYLNEVSYGNLSYGIEAAAQSYFGKSAADLTLAESAMLAGMPQSPSRYSPYTDPIAAKQRQSDVLDLMVRAQKITPEEADAARAVKLDFKPAVYPIQAPHFVNYVRDRLEARYGRRLVEQGGFKVITSLDLSLQDKAQKAVTDGVKNLAKIDANNAALVAMDPKNGEVLAMVGSADFWDDKIQGQVNVAMSPRQPGSTFKPISYLAAFLKGYTPATMLLDVATAYPDGANGPYIPENADGRYHGPVSARSALAMSLNPPAVATLQFDGIDTVLDLAHKMGITDLNQRNRYGLSLTLGGGEVKLLDLTYAYNVFAGGGVLSGSSVPPFLQAPGMRTIEPTVILQVTDPWGNVIEEHQKPKQERVVPAEYAYLITDILKDNKARAPMFGADSALKLGDRPAAVKTGTTTDYRDFWAVGYTSDLVAGVWVGNTNNKPMKPSFSSTTAAPIWNAFMTDALKQEPKTEFAKPANLETAVVCAISGLKPTAFCPLATETFVKGTAPTAICNVHRPFEADGGVTKVAYVLPPAAWGWMQAMGIGVSSFPWTGASVNLAPITKPISGPVDIIGTAAGDDLIRWDLEVGYGKDPKDWTLIGRSSGKFVGEKLARWTPGAERGPAVIRLTSLDRYGRWKTVQITVAVDPAL